MPTRRRSPFAALVLCALPGSPMLLGPPGADGQVLAPSTLAAARAPGPAFPRPQPRFPRSRGFRAEPSALGKTVGLYVGILGVGLAASAVGDPAPLECGPCDRREVPFFDRWAIAPSRPGWDYASDGLLLATAGMAWANAASRDGGFPSLLRSLESGLLAAAATELLKHAMERRRPYAFAEDTLTAGETRDAKQSWPSGHTSVAFAIATTHWLEHRGAAARSRALVSLAAALTGLLRIPAGRHFPSDVITGAGLGIGSALLVHTIRF